MPLALAGVGEKRTIKSFVGDEQPARHLCDMGFVAGEQVEILSESPAGLILLVKGVRVAVNRGLAQRIMVA